MIREYQNGLFQLAKTKEKMDNIENNFEEKLLRQINADYQNCLTAQRMAEETKDKSDISLFVWLVREFSSEVNSFDWFEKETQKLTD